MLGYKIIDRNTFIIMSFVRVYPAHLTQFILILLQAC